MLSYTFINRHPQMSDPGPEGPLVSFSGPFQILSSGGKQNLASAGVMGHDIVALSINSHEQTQLNRVYCYQIL